MANRLTKALNKKVFNCFVKILGLYKQQNLKRKQKYKDNNKKG